MIYLPTGSQMSEADLYTIEKENIPSRTLMERAASSCVDVLIEEELDLSSTLIVCGVGNNGGDGLAIARLLSEQGLSVAVWLVGDTTRMSFEAKEQLSQLQNTKVIIDSQYPKGFYSLIIDAIFGVGLKREIQGSYKECISFLNQQKVTKVAVDIPSGISSANGQVLGVALQVDLTIAIQCQKLGMALYPGNEYCGRIITKKIGISTLPFEKEKKTVLCFHNDDYYNLLPERPAHANKGTFGKVLVIGGSKGMAGAAYLNAFSAYKMGAGLVRFYTPETNRSILQTLLCEGIMTTYESFHEKECIELLSWADVVLIGSGLGLSETAKEILFCVLENHEKKLVIDGDALTLISQCSNWRERVKAKEIILTPHMKEMSRLLHCDVSTIQENRTEVLTSYVNKNQLCCVLKDERTLVGASNQNPVLNTSGNNAMAKAGSGDVLTGIIGGLLSHGLNAYESGVLGVYLHGLCGDIGREHKGEFGLMASDLAVYLKDAINYVKEVRK
ncbi:hydroxyethylthiazole kinase-like uncharacterized protein yjeF [Aequitasia blattaphilus]|uniref:Bifunctional NAD(P)H-hydrate repair enzyme n=1 Tax=Aequitasia blattaphilus TaxID=2949332 RepID=A0ABT1E7R5_9FIRM|nr:NAD(P)H-hydrate dehydratase [Aequitasia blattaphilus]MCP1101664.1 NAD(P)H-hydrate dehydratase [Aequitasia blattaphilus]MCR8614304.1 NAD(P)H-hydrate dehydratase [Aequitasia blattaphilus]